MKNRPWYWIVVLALATSSCLPDPLEVKSVPRARAEIVVSSQIIPDESLVVLLTKTFGALEASDNSNPFALLDQIALNDAFVALEGPDGIDTLQFLGNGLYGGELLSLRPGNTYHLHVNSRSLGRVRATTDVKRQAEFEEIDAELYYNGFGDTLAQITYTVSDSEDKNFYMVNVQEVELEDVIENLLNPRAFTVLMTDEGFDGQRYTERFRVFPRDYHPGDTIAVTLSNISEDYYNFMKLRLDNRYSFVEFISEPVNYASNVEGGRGFFNLYVPDVRFFVLE